MGKLRKINVHLNRDYRNDLNWNFEQIEDDIAKNEADIKKVETETLEKVNEIVGGGFIESLETARDAANTSATEANTQASYAKNQGDYAKEQGDYAKTQGDYAKAKGDYADEKAILADEAAGRAEQEASNLGQLKVDVVNATQAANTGAANANEKAVEAETAAVNANTAAQAANEAATKADVATQAAETATTNANTAATNAQNLVDTSIHRGEYNSSTDYVVNNEVRYNGSTWRCLNDCKGITPSEGEHWTLVAQRGVDGTGAVSTINNKAPDTEGNVQLTASDIGSITQQDAQALSDQAEANAKDASVSKEELGVAGGAARLNAEGKVIDAFNNEVEGAVKTVNGQTGNVKIPVFSGNFEDLNNKPVIPSKTSELSNDSDFVTAQDAQVLADQIEANAKEYTDLKNQAVNEKIDVLSDKLEKGESLNVSLNRGNQIITVDQDTPVNVLNLTGRTIINYAPLFDSGLWVSDREIVTIISPSSISMNATAPFQNYIVEFYYEESKEFSFSLKTNELKGYAVVSFINGEGNEISRVDGVGLNLTGQVTHSGITPVGTSKIKVTLVNQEVGTFTFENVMFNEGSEPQPFVANVKGATNPTIENKTTNKSITLLGTLHEGDKVNPDDTATRKKKEVELGGDFGWDSYIGDKVGYKKIQALQKVTKVALPDNTVKFSRIVKYNGSILVEGDTGHADSFQFDYANGYIALYVADIDSGWGETYTPLADEIKAYFLGWKMANTAIGWNEPYNGTGTKGWYYRDINGSPGGGTNTLPTTQAPINSKWQPYRLIYDLATPVTEQLESIGSISLYEGDNQIEVTEGRIVRERVTPVFEAGVADGDIYNINNSFSPISLLKNKVYKAYIYKNGYLDLGWKEFPNGTTSSKNGAVYQLKANLFDPSAIYEVDYIPLELYKITAPTNPITVEYQDKINSVVNELVEVSTNHKSDLSELKRRTSNIDKAITGVENKQGKLDDLTTEDKSSLVGALNEINAKPSGGGNGDDDWQLLDTVEVSDSNKWYAMSREFKDKLKKLKYVFRSVSNHWTTSGTAPIADLYVFFIGGGEAGKHQTRGYRMDFNNTSSPLQNQYNGSAKDTYTLVSVPSSSQYPYPEIHGEIVFERKDMSAGSGTTGYPSSLFMSGWLHVIDTKTSNIVIRNFRYDIEFMAYDPQGNHGNAPHSIGLRIDREPRFTRGIIEVWGVPL